MPDPLRFAGVTHHYGKLLSVDSVDITVHAGAFVALIGPSGSGKSTLIKIAAGLQQPSGGAVYLSGEPVRRRLGRTAYMPQSDALLPWRTVLDNVVLGAEIHGVNRRESVERAYELLALFGLEGFETVYPAELSGGMRQRAAFLRTFLADSSLLLLDEPLSALDAFTRAELQDWLLEVRDHFDYTIVLVTHDVQEAVYLADRVIVLTPRPGRVAAEVTVELPRPRDRNSPAFHQQVADLTTRIR